MRYRILVAPPAQKEIKDLPGYVRAQARELLEALASNPRPARAKELRDRPRVYRLWLARRWRIAYAVDDELLEIRILRVRLKDHIGYETLTPEG